MMMSPVRRIAFAASLAALPVACGFPTFSYTSTSTGGASSTSTGNGGSGTSCRLLHDAEDCGPSQRCTIADEATGDTHCVTLASPAMALYEACADDVSCPAGTWCDYRTDTCTPFCVSASDCGKGACVGARNGEGKSIPGASVCTAYCDPINPASCGQGAACNYDAKLAEFDCYRSKNYVIGNLCMFANCAPTMVCTSQCVLWCHPIDQPSAECGGAVCQHFTNLTPVYEKMAYGFCAP